MTVRLALFAALFTGCASTSPPPPDPALAARLSRCSTPPPSVGPDGQPAQKLDKREVVAAMSCIKYSVGRCYDRWLRQGIAMVRFTVDPRSGMATSISLDEGAGRDLILGSTREGACIIEAARGARFPTFGGEPMTFSYPFMLR